jgi:PAS domain S-box-containing protein
MRDKPDADWREDMVLRSYLDLFSRRPAASRDGRRTFICGAAIATALLGVCVLLGWAIDAPLLRSIIPGAVQMKANTAVALIVSAAALWLAAPSPAGHRRTLAQCLAVLPAVIGIATLAQYQFGWNLSIDEALVRDTASAFNSAKGRMSPYSAAAFVALGAALSTLPYRGASLGVRALSGIVVLIGGVSLLGYLWNASELVTDNWLPPVAVHTAFAFLILGSAAFLAALPPAARTDAGGSTRVETKILGGFVLAVLTIIVGGGFTYRSVAQFAAASSWVSHTHEVRLELVRLYSEIAKAESAQRNYVLAGAPTLRDEFDLRVREVRRRAEAVTALVGDNPEQLTLSEDLRRLAEARIVHLQGVGETYDRNGPAASREIATGIDIAMMERIRSLALRMDDAEAVLLRTREIELIARQRATLVSLLLTLLVASLLFALLFQSIRHQMRARTAAQDELHHLNATLEQRVDERTAELSYQQAFLRKVIDLNRGFIFAKDRDGRFMLANEAFAEAHGTSVEGLLGKTAGDFNRNADEVGRFHADDCAVIDSGQELVIDEEKSTDVSGRVRWLHTVKRPISMPDGKTTLLLGVCTDITQRKAAEDAAREAAAHLEHRVDERTRDLHQSNLALQEARLEADEANRAKSAFLATMSHEIRTPMNGVIGMVEVLARSRLDAQQRDAIQTIKDSSFILLGLIDDVLDFSKIEAGKLDLERTPVQLADVIEGLCRSLAPVAAGKGVALRVFVDPQLPARLWADPTRFRQVLTNLVGNAIKFSGDREGTPGRVSVRACRAGPDEWTLQVVDNGIGIAAAKLGHLFAFFNQAETSTTRRFGGTGLGLAISQRLVGLMGGSIAASSEPGVGSVFTLRLPIDAVEGIAPPLPEFDLLGIDCIVVEGQDMDGADLAAYLEPVGAKVHRVQSTRQAMALAGRLPSAVMIAHQARERDASVLETELEGAPEIRKVLLVASRDASTDWDAANTVAIDSNALRRVSLLRAVGAAAGRMSLEVQAAPTSPEVGWDATPAPTIADARARGRLILVAEDDAINRKVILHQLGTLGYAAEMANDGVEALALWRQGGHGLLLTDLHMPEMDGYTLAAVIRSEEGQDRLPILALTANALKGEVARARAAGIDEYLTKPMQVNLLGAVLEKWLLPRASDAAMAVPAGAPAPVYDAAVLPSLIGDDSAVLQSFLRDYLVSARKLAAEIRHAVTHEDSHKVAACAHKLKASSRAVGALALGDVCAALENAALKTGLADLARHCAEFERALAATAERLQAPAQRATEAAVS